MRRAVGSLWYEDEGAVVPTVALSLTALIAVGGIAFDYAHLASLDTELQQAADQAALAAATQLDGQTGAVARATAAAQSLITNSTLFASHIAGGRSTDVAIATVTLCSAFDDSQASTATACTATTNDAAAKFAWVRVSGRTAVFALTPVVGALSSGTVGGEAVATLNSAICKEPPVMMCNPAETSTVTTFNPSSYVGDGIRLTSVGNGGGSWAPGNFGYIDTNISTVNGQENQLRASLGWNSPPGECSPTSGLSTKPGANVSVTDALNTRFDIYDSNVSCLSGGSCPASINSVKDVRRPANANGGNACKLHNQGWQLDTSGTGYYGRTVPTTTADLPVATIPSAMGHPRDKCHAISNSGSCSGGRVGDGNWDVNAYFRTNYVRTVATSCGGVGTRWTSGSGTCSWQGQTGLSMTASRTLSSGQPNPAYASRYNVYNWEIANRGTVKDGVTVLGQRPVPASGGTLVSYGAPQCSTGQVPNATTPDRRRISMAVVNCQANSVNGSANNVPVIKWVDLFLVEPSLNRARTNNGDIYVEVIGETLVGGGTAPAGSVIRHDVPVLIR